MLIDTEPEAAALVQLRAAEGTGQPLGADAFITRLEQALRRTLRRQNPGRKRGAKLESGELFGAAESVLPLRQYVKCRRNSV